MPFRIIEGDITRLTVDAIVNAANSSLLGGGGVDGAIHRAAGPRLLEECRTLNGCQTGEAKVTRGYDLPCKYVIHTVGPIWHGGGHQEEALLRSAYRHSLEAAKEKCCESVAFPLISAGVYGYPKDQALAVAVDTIRTFLVEHEMDVTLVIFSKDSFRLDSGLYVEISSYVEARVAEDLEIDFCASISQESAPSEEMPAPKRRLFARKNRIPQANREVATMSMAAEEMCDRAIDSKDDDLALRLRNLDESFSQALLRMIDEKGMKDSECYKHANIDRKLFSKIRSDVNYRPSKQTVLAFAVALELNLAETEEFLRKAGYALSHSNKTDVIVEYFIDRGNYDIYTINEALFAFDQKLLGT